MIKKIALAGNPNSGKTTLFNALTGANQSVGNWPGVTVEKKEGVLRGKKDVRIIDLPGIYSLSPYSPEERVARNYLRDETPDAIINIIDGSNLERNLYLTTQLTELSIPVVAAVNMIDVVKKRGESIDCAKLSKKLGIPVVEISALKGTGLDALVKKAYVAAEEKTVPVVKRIFQGSVEKALAEIELAFADTLPADRIRWYSIKLFEGDPDVMAELKDNVRGIETANAVRERCETEFDDDAESIITSERYAYISALIKESHKRQNESLLTMTDKIDAVVTNRVMALPIFAAIIFAVYYISVTTVGAFVTDWTNDVLFGEIIPPAAEGILAALNVADWLQSLVLDGIIAGVGAVLGFVPQMLVLFALLAVLEYSGYMARVAFILDRIFRRFGLSGKSFIPMIVATGCGVPGIMASRTIENEHDRRMTIMTATFMPCGAKLPIIALIAGALFDGTWWVAPSAYFVGIASIIISGLILKKTALFAGESAPFVMELPDYHMPSLFNVLSSMWERGWSFIKKAGTIILLSTIFVWFTSSFGYADGRVVMVEDLSDGFLAAIGRSIAWIFAPLGWGTWQSAVAAFTGLVAKENVVGTFGILFGFAEVSEEGEEIWQQLAAHYTPLAAYSFMLFNLLCAPCFAAMGAIKREMNSTKWTCLAIGYQTGYAYAVAFVAYQLGLVALEGKPFTAWTAIAAAVLLAAIYLLVRPQKKDSAAIDGRVRAADIS
ncbi:ferrous iron transport protein B [Cloacibacillus evryensis]|uniref:ferrous iron transport protein B n=1 Tax=Cloacibacillus evryensis TaxID=508460 RepID=UPI00045331B3|nr:ferrous iron transport protein B [Cloacibacillus evryensis]EXG78014.1 ferrous iron transporter FeoB [Cloacibacillus evryensis DSM 19522]MEA5036138.1 ferrous iron transport protein B [Cloacibacillus evryensis]